MTLLFYVRPYFKTTLPDVLFLHIGSFILSTSAVQSIISVSFELLHNRNKAMNSVSGSRPLRSLYYTYTEEPLQRGSYMPI
jgi:hypothetical protein